MARGDAQRGTTTRSHGSLYDSIAGEATIWWLSIVHHPDRGAIGRRVPLSRQKIELGRDGTCFGPDALADGRMSRHHSAVGMAADGSARITDRDSRNGTFVNGERVRKAVLKDGDVIGLGSILLLLHQGPPVFVEPRHPRLIGASWSIGRTVSEIEQVAPYGTPVLILGETGTGKELVAREIHHQSRRKGHLESINCGGLSDDLLQSELFGHVRGAFSGADRDRTGLLEVANGGTVFLDEIGDASPALQVGLLRYLQEGEVRRLGSNRTSRVDTRIVAATHRDLPDLVGRGEFREDLYARLTGWTIQIPPLRARREDIPLLVDHFVREMGRGGPRQVHHRLFRRLLSYLWPRNVRELRAVIERAVIEAGDDEVLRLTPALADRLQAVEVAPTPATKTGEAGRAAPAERPTKEALALLLVEHDGNIRQVAAALGVARNTVYRWLKALGIDRAAARRPAPAE